MTWGTYVFTDPEVDGDTIRRMEGYRLNLQEYLKQTYERDMLYDKRMRIKDEIRESGKWLDRHKMMTTRYLITEGNVEMEVIEKYNRADKTAEQ